eukprot:Gb_03754 [translate_table: standard]
MLPSCRKLTSEVAKSFLGVFLPSATTNRASEPARSRANPSRSSRIVFRPCLATISMLKLWRSTRDWQALLEDESRVPNSTSYCGICMHDITVRTDVIFKLAIVLAWPCLDGIDVDCESLGLTAKRRGLAIPGTPGMSTEVVLWFCHNSSNQILWDYSRRMDALQVMNGGRLIHASRFSYCAVCCLSMLHRLDKIDVGKAISYIASCKNFDGGFGCTPGAESHAGQSALAILGALNHVDKDLLGWWLCERQVKSGGLNGRPEKLADVCYSWWVLSSLIMIHRVHWIDKEKLKFFILDCQDREHGGISDRPDDAVDVFHTFFGVAGLSLLEYPGLKPIDPAYALPVHVVDRIFFDLPHY